MNQQFSIFSFKMIFIKLDFSSLFSCTMNESNSRRRIQETQTRAEFRIVIGIRWCIVPRKWNFFITSACRTYPDHGILSNAGPSKTSDHIHTGNVTTYECPSACVCVCCVCRMYMIVVEDTGNNS